ncbi:MAG: ATP-binding protein [Bradyrhizobium sp.]|mgnify:CR=1 FL=1|jgi:hypothetical protein|nr:ATP-binding protein [Bradyrhizobium sp.]
MALLHIPLNQIEEQHILELIATRAPETNIIEYKRETYGHSLRDDLEFLADVSSLANTSGGDLIIGFAATQGIPEETVPFTGDFDAEINRLEGRARAGLQPRISLESRAVAVQGGHILILRVARSYNPPHRIIRENSNRFWARSTAGKYEPNVDQLRELFTLAPRIADQTREFRTTRLIRIASGDAPVTLMHKDVLVLHVVPFSAFDRDAPLPMAELERDYMSFHPIGSRQSQALKINFDGFLAMSNGDRAANVERAYVQLFRGGIVEAVDGLYARASGEPLIPVVQVERNIAGHAMRLMRDLAAIGIEPPYAVLASLLTAEKARFNFAHPGDGAWYDRMGSYTDRPQYAFGEVIFDSAPANVQGCAQRMRPLLDQLAQSGGMAESVSFRSDGTFVTGR